MSSGSSKWFVLLVALGASGAALADGTITQITAGGISGISGDGRYVAGANGFASDGSGNFKSTRWNASTLVEEQINGVSAASVNASGMIAGTIKINQPATYTSPGVASAGTTSGFAVVGPGFTGGANSVSNDGKVVGSSGAYGGVGSVTTAFLWTQSGGMTSLPMPAGVDPAQASLATMISDDGHTIVGQAGTVGIVWNDLVPSVLTNGQGGNLIPAAISHNGQFIAGVVARPANDAAIPLDIWRWSQAGGYEQFRLVPAGMKTFTLSGISDDGKTVIGTQNTSASAFGISGIVWTQAGGTRVLSDPSGGPDYLTGHNVPLPAWWGQASATYLTAMSADGRTLGGKEKNGLTNATKAFVIQITGNLPPTVTKRFAPALITNEQASTLTITLSNGNAADLTLSTALTDTFPIGLVVASAPAASTTCNGGLVNADAGASSVSLSAGARIPANGSCTVAVAVTSAVAGTYPNVIPAGALQTSGGDNANPATATLGVTTAVHYPTAAITPNALSLSVEAGASGTLPLTIGNIGEANLTFSVTEAAGAARAPATSYATARMAGPAQGAGQPSAVWQLAGAQTNGRGVAVALDGGSMSQMTDNTPGTTGASCGANDGSSTSDNSWWRRFYFSEYPGIGTTTHILSVTIASGPAGPNGVPVSINLYTIPHSTAVDTIDTSLLTPIGSGIGAIDSGFVTATIPVSADVDDTAGKDLVVEYHIDGTAGRFLPGANATAETHPTFISSQSCSLPAPAPVSTIGAGNFHLVMIVNVGSVPVCQNPSDVPWLSESPASGTVAPGASTDVTVTANAASLIAGSYSANLCVATNDPTQPLTAVPVTLTVTPAPAADDIFCNGFENGGTGACANHSAH